MRKLSTLCFASSLALLSACSAGQPASSAQIPGTNSSSDSPIASAINRAMDRANAKLATRNIIVSGDDDNAPKAEITPQGDFLIAGKSVPLTPAQRAQMLAYRQQVVEIARQGIAIGKQGATLGMRVAGEALAAVFAGQSRQQIREHAEAQTSGIREAAAKICDRLPALMASQQKLAVEVPAFKPYATTTQEDIVHCREDALHGDHDD